MSILIPFNRKNSGLARMDTGFEDFYNMLDDFFSDGVMPSRNPARDTFKLDIAERESEYLVEAEIPGIKREEIDLSVDDESLCILVKRSEELEKDDKNYLHRERRSTSMSRKVRLANANLDEVTAKLEDGVLLVSVPKDIRGDIPRKIEIG